MKSRAALHGVIELLKKLGFKASGTTLNRPAHDRETTHVVYVQSGRGFLEGKFTIEMGVFLKSIFPMEWWAKGKEVPRFPHINDCQIRARLSEFAGAGDIWWPSGDVQSLADLEPAIRTFLPQFFDAWGEPLAILKNCLQGRSRERRESVSPVAVTILLHQAGCDSEAAATLKREYAWFREKGKTPPEWIMDLARRLGLEFTVEL